MGPPLSLGESRSKRLLLPPQKDSYCWVGGFLGQWEGVLHYDIGSNRYRFSRGFAMKALISLAVALLGAFFLSGQGEGDRKDSTQNVREELEPEIKGKAWPQIKTGITVEEVEQILGPPWNPKSGDNRTPTVTSFKLPEGFPEELSLEEVTVRLWLRDESAVFVGFDPQERVCFVVPSGVYHRDVDKEEGIWLGPFWLPRPEQHKIMLEDPFQ
jgi:hypothetical protein